MEDQDIKQIKTIIEASTLLSTTEKQEWLDLCDVMNDEQLIELRSILLSVVHVVKPPVPTFKPSVETKPLPLKHILNLPTREQSLPNKASLPVAKAKSPSKFWQKVKNLLSEKELPAGHPNPTQELELPEHANLPVASLAKHSETALAPRVIPKIPPKPAVKPLPTPKPPASLNRKVEKKSSEVVMSSTKETVHKPVISSVRPVSVLTDNQIPSEKPVKSATPLETTSQVSQDVSVPNISEKVRETPVSVTTTPTVLNIPKLENLKVDKLVVNEDSYNEKSSYKVINPEELKKTILQNTSANLLQVKDKIISEPKSIIEPEGVSTSSDLNSQTSEPAFVPGLANPNILAEAKLTPVKAKSSSIALLVANDFGNLEQVSALSQDALAKDLVPALKHLIGKVGFFEVYSALEKSPLFASYINTGLNVLAGKAEFNAQPKQGLNKDQFERFVDVLRGIKH